MTVDYQQIKTLDDLENALDDDLAWRKKEMTMFKFLLKEAKEDAQREAITKSSIAIFYAHWEGHVKFCTKAYLTYLNAQSLTCDQVKDNFFLLFLSSKLGNNTIVFHKIDYSQRLLDLIQDRAEHTLEIAIEKLIKTSNLDYAELTWYLQCLGIQTDFYKTKNKLLDEVLIKTRHKIAHGTYVPFQQARKTLEAYQTHIIHMIEKFNELVREAATQESYFIKEYS